jgi:hypothetical protein
MWRNLCGLAAWGLLSVGILGPAKAGLVVNGGFEAPIVSGTYYDLSDAGQSFLGWTVGQGRVAHGTDANDPAHSIKAYEGHQWLQLAGLGGTNGSIYQDLTTVPGTTYVLSFAATGNPGAGQIMQMEVGWGGSTISSLSFDPTGFTFANPGWKVFTFDVTANTATTHLEFTNVTSGANAGGPVIDAVSVTAASVPEPSSLVMSSILLALVGGTALLKRRRRP